MANSVNTSSIVRDAQISFVATNVDKGVERQTWLTAFNRMKFHYDLNITGRIQHMLYRELRKYEYSS